MALNIKDPETDRLARELAELTGESITETIKHSLRRRLDVERGFQRTPEEKRAAIDAILARIDAIPDRDTRTADEILGYDENGLPT